MCISSINCCVNQKGVVSLFQTKTNIMTTIKTTYKGNTYTVTMRGRDFAYAQDANGYYVTDVKTIQALTINN